MGIMIFLAFLLGFGGLIYLIHRKRLASDGLTPMERKHLDYPDREILSMLRQYGEPMRQSEMIDALPADFHELVQAIKRMETKGLIIREWLPDQGTFNITARTEGL